MSVPAPNPAPPSSSDDAPDRSLRYPPSASTSSVARAALSRATAAAGTAHSSCVSSAIRGEVDDWRWRYHVHAVDHVRACADASPEECADLCEAGLDALYRSFAYGRDGGTLREALDRRRESSRRGGEKGEGRRHFGTGRVVGKRKPPMLSPSSDLGDVLTLPVGSRNLRGPEVHARMDEWCEKGVIEPDAAAAVRTLRPSDLDLSGSEWAFVVMGAGAAMGPLGTLLGLGATVVALDLPVPAVWTRLTRAAEDSPGTLLFPLAPSEGDGGGDGGGGDGGNGDDDIVDVTASNAPSLSSRAGCDLLSQIPQLIDWLTHLLPDRRLVLGSYAYLDSSAFVRVSLAMDAVASETLRERPNSALAYLCSPTDVFAVPPGARDAAVRRAERGGRTRLERWAAALAPKGRVLDPNIVASTRNSPSLPLVDALVLQQGPNYFLAKRLQHWRAMLASHRHGAIVSSNVAPATRTQSVLKNRLLAAAYAGASRFEPVEIFDPQTSNVLMTYLLLHDLRRGLEREEEERRQRDAAAGRPPPSLFAGRADLADHPLNLFATTAVHGGIWRCGFQIRSLLELALAYYFADRCKGPAMAAAAAGAGAAILRSRM